MHAGKLCNNKRSTNPVYVQPYGFPINPANNLAKSLGIAVRKQTARWEDILNDATPVATCDEAQTALEPITPAHCAGILMVTAICLLLSMVQSCFKCVRNTCIPATTAQNAVSDPSANSNTPQLDGSGESEATDPAANKLDFIAAQACICMCYIYIGGPDSGPIEEHGSSNDCTATPDAKRDVI